jgi:hypothetical protein
MTVVVILVAVIMAIALDRTAYRAGYNACLDDLERSLLSEPPQPLSGALPVSTEPGNAR